MSLPLLTEIAGWMPSCHGRAHRVSYAIGSAIRFNIAHGEKLFAAGRAGVAAHAGTRSHLALAFAYFISVAYYLSLLAAFLFKGIGDPTPARQDHHHRRACLHRRLRSLRGLRGLETSRNMPSG